MFLDDGVSRQSAPTKKGYKGEGDTEGRWADSDMDKKAKNEFREVKIEQVRTSHPAYCMGILQTDQY